MLFCSKNGKDKKWPTPIETSLPFYCAICLIVEINMLKSGDIMVNKMNDAQLEIGSKAPDFCLPNKEEKEICLNKYRGKWVVLYFYPKDNTKGCTMEAIDFTQHLEEFEKLGAVVIGVSPDSPKSHQRFMEKHGLKLKKMYGREYYGVERSTFLIDPDGKIAYIWRKVKVKGHVEDVLNKLKELKEQ